MKIFLGADKDGMVLKDVVKEFLVSEGCNVVDLAEEAFTNFVESAKAVANEVLKDDSYRGILFDKYGAGSYVSVTKIPGVVAAEVSDERSAYMTREHNNSKIITMGQEIVGQGLAKNIAKEFLAADYDGGRHQIRVDMLSSMC